MPSKRSNKRKAERPPKKASAPPEDRVPALTLKQFEFMAGDIGDPRDEGGVADTSFPELRREVCCRLTDDELGALVSIPNSDANTLLYNLYALWCQNEEQDPDTPLTEAIIGYTKTIAQAIRNNEKECLGRLTKSWFLYTHSQSPRDAHWNQERAKSLRRIRQFKDGLAELQRDWPPRLSTIYNTALPQEWFPIINPEFSAVSNMRADSPAGDYPQAFLEAAQDFVRQWNLEKLFLDAGQLQFIPARVTCASDIEGQGIYVFIPRYYNWSRVRNDNKGKFTDFKSVKAMIDKTYAKFSPPKRKPFDEMAEDCKAFVERERNGRELTSALLKELVDKWCCEWTIERDPQTGEVTYKYQRSPSDQQRKKYYQFLLEEYGLEA